MNKLIENRIIGSGIEKLDGILFNPKNWRVHPKIQQDAMLEVLKKVGWVQQVIINQNTGHLVDGHLRCQLAAREGETEIPVTYVDLTEEEEELVLATYDPIGSMAKKDTEKFEELMKRVAKTQKDLKEHISNINDVSKVAGVEKSTAVVYERSQPYLNTDVLYPCDYAHTAMTEKEFGTLKKSMSEVGIIQPLLVRPIGSGKFEVVDGNQRLRAARELKILKVPVTIKNLTRQEAIVARFATDEIGGKPISSLVTKAVEEVGDEEMLERSGGISKQRLDAYKHANNYGVKEHEDGTVERDYKDYTDVEEIWEDNERILMIKLSVEDYEFVIEKLESVGKDLGRSLVKILRGE